MAKSMHWREEIAAPPERVFAALAEPDQVAKWMPGFVRFERLTPGPLAVGSRLRETRKMMGHEATEEFEVIVYEPPRVFGLYVDGRKGSSKQGEFRFRYTLAPGGPGTILTVDGEFGGLTGCMGGCMFLLGPLMAGFFRKAIAKDHTALKAYCETRGAASN